MMADRTNSLGPARFRKRAPMSDMRVSTRPASIGTALLVSSDSATINPLNESLRQLAAIMTSMDTLRSA